MILTVHQPEHLPWLGFFHKMASADAYVILDSVQYRHHYFQNRNRILGSQGPMYLTVPVLKQQSLYGPIFGVLIDNGQAWRQHYWAQIEENYRRHPYYKQYDAPLKAILFTPYELLVDLNLALLDFFREALGITTPLIRASAGSFEGKRSELLVDICRKLDASVYLSGPSGRDYLEESLFGPIQVRYHDFLHPAYPQRERQGFTPLLSALDLLMNCGPDSRGILLASPLAAENRPALGAS